MLVDDEDVGKALVDAATHEASAFRASHLELRHVARQCQALPFRQHKLRMAMPLAATPEAHWTALDRKIRNQVRKAQKENLIVTAGGAELVGEFYAVFARNMRDLGTPVYPRSLFAETVAAFPDSATVHLVRREGQAIAAGFTVRFRDTVLNPWASSLREFRSLCPNVLLYWAMVEQAVRAGASVFDFGRSSPGGGTHQFKEQWGAKATPMHWEYVLLSRAEPPNQGPSNPKFERLIETWKRLPLPVANIVGPMIARQLP
jgi:FemAB-related protein (PEP-CTERM system-associated)